MNIMVISFVILIIPPVFAFEFHFDSPETVEINETFKVLISSETSDSYDVKIFVHNSSDKSISRSEIISSIFADKWQDSWLYISSSFPDQKNYELKATEASGNSELCVQLRKTGKTSYFKECKSIKITENSSSSKEIIAEKEKQQTTTLQKENFSNISPIQEISTKQGNLRNILIVSTISVVFLILILLILKPNL